MTDTAAVQEQQRRPAASRSENPQCRSRRYRRPVARPIREVKHYIPAHTVLQVEGDPKVAISIAQPREPVGVNCQSTRRIKM
jgi:hypothetical protein